VFFAFLAHDGVPKQMMRGSQALKSKAQFIHPQGANKSPAK
jgi:hypothetical protein